MYQFNIVHERDGDWRFELDGITLIIKGYAVKDGKHWMENPETAIAFFNLNGNVYSVSNNINRLKTAEDLYASLLKEYKIFRTQWHGGSKGDSTARRYA
jgi:hypothetical protein